MNKTQYRPDHEGIHRKIFEQNRRKIYATQSTCGICGQPVDFSLKMPDPGSPCIDHIIPISKGGHPSDINNLQLAHMACNRQKSDKLFKDTNETRTPADGLPWSVDWVKLAERANNEK